ncbi:MAG: hypothetical protein IT381_06190 [Deltaproteobacteria bacterium]|nr:hypothetical protein [Deltaproteobacteria bacterium]
MRDKITVSKKRWAFGLSVLTAWGAACIAMAQFGGTLGAIVGGALFTVPLCSLGEWLVHGVLYHSSLPGLEFIQKIHHAGHHFALFPPKHYVQTSGFPFMRFRKPYVPFTMSDNALDNLLTMGSQVGLHFVVGIPLIVTPAWLLTENVVFAASTLATLALISWLLAYVHGAIHTPGDRLIERMGWFQWLDRHHYIHHVDLSANINFMLPLCDVLLGTNKLALTPEEAARVPSFEQAKPMAKDIPAGKDIAPQATPAIVR